MIEGESRDDIAGEDRPLDDEGLWGLLLARTGLGVEYGLYVIGAIELSAPSLSS